MQQITLLDNANDFIREALTKALLAEQTPRQWKYAIINLAQTIELLLKERLRKEHPALVFSNVDSPNHTVTLELAISRLEKIGGVKLTTQDRCSIKIAYELRNRIIHYEFALSETEVKAVFARLLGFAVNFGKRELNNELDIVLPKELWSEAMKIRDYTDELYERAKKDLEAAGISPDDCWLCSACGYALLFVEAPGEAVCPVCGHTEEIFQCEDCWKLFYWDNLREYETGNTVSDSSNDEVYPVSIKLCEECFSKRRNDDENYWHYLESKSEI